MDINELTGMSLTALPQFLQNHGLINYKKPTRVLGKELGFLMQLEVQLTRFLKMMS